MNLIVVIQYIGQVEIKIYRMKIDNFLSICHLSIQLSGNSSSYKVSILDILEICIPMNLDYDFYHFKNIYIYIYIYKRRYPHTFFFPLNHYKLYN